MSRQPPIMTSSPPSSNDATHFGTPSTNMTVLSQDTANSANKESTAPRFGLRVNTNPASSANHLGLPAAAAAPLSPTAEEFTPSTAAFSPFAHGPGVSPVRNLVASSMPDMSAPQPMAHGTIGQASTWAIRNVYLKIRLESDMIVAWNAFSTDENVTRTFQINEKVVNSLHHFWLLYSKRFSTLSLIDTKDSDLGVYRLTFLDDREAKQAYMLTASLVRGFGVLNQATPKDIAIAYGRDPNAVSNYEGQLLVTVLYDIASTMPMLDEFHELLSVFGKVKAMASVKPLFENSVSFRVEYHNVNHAELALKNLPHENIQKMLRYVVVRYEPDVSFVGPNPSGPSNTSNHNGGNNHGSNHHGGNNHGSNNHGSNSNDGSNHSGKPSMTGRTTIPTGDFARLENVMARVMRESSSSSRGTTRVGHNVVDISRIEAGLDVRTTIMLRNIPNKIDQDTLKQFLDATSFGDYDFMYLRIDFANNCNVGYAFINFIDPLAIIPFARARAGRRWNIFNSDKVAEISYATIQGRDCLVQKFRNSSVMLEHPSYRPKLYRTRPHVFAGQEESFPDPDNYSKMRRSIDNAEHIGLFSPRLGRIRAAARARVHRQHTESPFHPNTPTPPSMSPSVASSSTFGLDTDSEFGLFAPREGQAHREEQRRRRSQFDRGTPGAEIELSTHSLTDSLWEDQQFVARAAAAFNRLRF